MLAQLVHWVLCDIGGATAIYVGRRKRVIQSWDSILAKVSNYACLCTRAPCSLRLCMIKPQGRNCSQLIGWKNLFLCLPFIPLCVHFHDIPLAAGCIRNALLPALLVEIANSQTCVYISVKHMMRVVKPSMVLFLLVSLSEVFFFLKCFSDVYSRWEWNFQSAHFVLDQVQQSYLSAEWSRNFLCHQNRWMGLCILALV